MESRKGQVLTVGTLIMLAMTLIVGAILFTASAQQVSDVTDLDSVVNETVSLTTVYIDVDDVNESISVSLANEYDSDSWAYSNCPMSSFSLTTSDGSPLEATTDYVFTTTGSLTFVNSTDIVAVIGDDNETLASYSFCPTTYGTSSGSRSVSTIVVLLTALALAAVAISYGVKIKR